MDFYPAALLFHILGACVWTGGHIVLAVGLLPGALRRRDVAAILSFEAIFERVGMPALAVQIATGVWLALRLLPNIVDWTDLGNPLARAVLGKLLLLALTVALAVHARLFVIPRLDAQRLPMLAWHIAGVTLFAVLFVALGASVRFGGI